MVDPRVYRAAFVPLLLALVVSSFSLVSRPAPRSSTLAPDAFTGADAMGILRSLATRHPDRRPGGTGDEALASEIAGRFEAAQLTTTQWRFDARTVEGPRTLRTVLGQRPGALASSIVVLAHRDSAAPGSPAELSGTAALLELAQIFSGRLFRHTIVLASTSGGSGGAAGAADLARHLPGPVDAVLALGDLGGVRARRPFVVPFSSGVGLAPLVLQRTVQEAVRREAGVEPGLPGVVAQFAHLALPVALGEQGPLDARGIPAVTLQVSGERGPDPPEGVSQGRLENLGRAALSAVNALDAGPEVPSAPATGLIIDRKVLPQWAVRLVVGALLLPALVAGLDGWARARRRRAALRAWTGWALGLMAPFLLAGLLALALRLTGLLSAAPAGPVLPSILPVQGGALAAVGAVVVLGLLARALLLRSGGHRPPAAPGAPVIPLLLALDAAAMIVWVLDPFAALLLVPAMHLWLLLSAEDLPLPRWGGVVLVLAGLLGPAALLIVLAHELALSAVGLAWMGLLAVAGGWISLLGLVLASVICGCAVGALVVGVRRRPAPEPLGERSVRGPLGYAGPGSLGGTESALRR